MLWCLILLWLMSFSFKTQCSGATFFRPNENNSVEKKLKLIKINLTEHSLTKVTKKFI